MRSIVPIFWLSVILFGSTLKAFTQDNVYKMASVDATKWCDAKKISEVSDEIDRIAAAGFNTISLGTFKFMPMYFVDYSRTKFPDATVFDKEKIIQNVSTLRQNMQRAKRKGITYIISRSYSHYIPYSFWQARQSTFNKDGIYTRYLENAHQNDLYKSAVSGKKGEVVGHQQWTNPVYKDYFITSTNLMLDALPELDGFLNAYAEAAWTLDENKLKQNTWKSWKECINYEATDDNFIDYVNTLHKILISKRGSKAVLGLRDWYIDAKTLAKLSVPLSDFFISVKYGGFDQPVSQYAPWADSLKAKGLKVIHDILIYDAEHPHPLYWYDGAFTTGIIKNIFKAGFAGIQYQDFQIKGDDDPANPVRLLTQYTVGKALRNEAFNRNDAIKFLEKYYKKGAEPLLRSLECVARAQEDNIKLKPAWFWQGDGLTPGGLGTERYWMFMDNPEAPPGMLFIRQNVVGVKEYTDAYLSGAQNFQLKQAEWKKQQRTSPVELMDSMTRYAAEAVTAALEARRYAPVNAPHLKELVASAIIHQQLVNRDNAFLQSALAYYASGGQFDGKYNPEEKLRNTGIDKRKECAVALQRQIYYDLLIRELCLRYMPRRRAVRGTNPYDFSRRIANIVNEKISVDEKVDEAELQRLTGIIEGTGTGGAVSLNGEWEMGFARKYTATVKVPGIAADPSKMVDEQLWYKKNVTLPTGDWEFATLELKGARFMPEVFVNGKPVSKQNGGMAPTFHLLKDEEVKPGKTIVLEIALQPLKKLSPADASFIPPADQWRSNVSSGLWDDVVLHPHGNLHIDRIIPFPTSIHYDLQQVRQEKISASVLVELLDENDKVLSSRKSAVSSLHDSLSIDYKKLKAWSPEEPVLYQLRLTVMDKGGNITDSKTIPFGLRQFEVRNKQFFLNQHPAKLRGGTVVWHRWMRSAEGRELGFDTAWFRQNIVQRLKDHGANYLRFHLGKPPERLLDLCDKYGLLVQYEWSFFHGMPATKESLLEQYKNWLDVAMRHPSVVLIHPYNETEGEQLHTVWEALDTLLKDYPSLVMEERDVIHVHKYWWSLFENLGLYYDDASQFPKAIMVDEFGGNYLDEKGDLGGYKALKESYLRFLGREHNAAERLAFHAQSNAKVAEYWRRIGAAGFAPFCMLSSFEDGNTWFLGKLKEGNEKPVWKELTAAFAPQSVSLDIWDKNFLPAQEIQLPVYFFNDTKDAATLKAKITIGKNDTVVTESLLPYSKKVKLVKLVLPAQTGDYTLQAELLNKPVISAWDIHICSINKPALKKIAVADDEAELKTFFQEQGISTTSLSDTTSRIIAGSVNTWQRIIHGDTTLLSKAIDRGASIVLLDVGEKYLGQGYPDKNGELGPLQGVARITDPKITTYHLFKGVSLKFTEAAEPESHIHADVKDSSLWSNIPKKYTWLWNGMRGGLIAPAADMEVAGLSSAAFLAQWAARGANAKAIQSGNYYAYELQGFFDFSTKPDDNELIKRLKDKVSFLVQDAPALANAINPATPVKVTDLSSQYQASQQGQAQDFISLAACGKNLTRTPVALVTFGQGKGNLLISQLLTNGRLDKKNNKQGLQQVRYDPVAAQMVMNMLQRAVK